MEAVDQAERAVSEDAAPPRRGKSRLPRPLRIVSAYSRLAFRASYVRFTLPAITVVAAGLALFELGRKSLWHDEAFSVAAAGGGWQQLLELMATPEINMSLYHALLSVWLVLGTDEVTVRLLSAVFAVATVPVVYLLGRDLFSPRVGLTAALFVALNAFVVQYAQEARSYALVLFLASLSTFLLIRALRQSSQRVWVGYAIVVALLPFAHLAAASIWIAHALAIAIHEPRSSWRLVAVPIVGAAIASAPVLWVVATAAGRAIVWVPRTTVRGVADSWIALAGAGLPAGSLRLPGLTLVVLVLGLACLGALVTWLRGEAKQRWAAALIVLWLLVPVATLVGVSVVKPMYVPRYLLIVVPAVALLASLGIWGIRHRGLRLLALASLVALSLLGLNNWYRHNPKPDWRAAAAHVLTRAGAEDRSVFIADWGVALQYYARQTGAEDRVPTPLLPNLNYADPSFPTALRELAIEASSEHRIVWVFAAGRSVDPVVLGILAPFRELYEPRSTESFELLTVTWFEPRVAP